MRSLAEILDPNFRSKQQDRQLRIEIESAKLQQKGQTHYDQMSLGYNKLNQDSRIHRENMNLGYDKLRQENQIHNSNIAQSDRHHSDKMGALSRQNDIREKQVNSRIKLDESRLLFDIQNALNSRDATVYTAHLQALTSIKLAEMGHANAMEQLNQNFRNQTALVSHQAHTDFVKSSNMLFVDRVNSQLQRGNDLNASFASGLAEMMKAKANYTMAYKLAEQQEKHRENERKHEVTMAILKSNLDRSGFTYEEILKFAIRLIDPTYTTKEGDEDFEQRVSDWYQQAKKDLQGMA